VLEILFAIFVAQFNVSVEYFFSVLFTPYCFYQMSGEKRCSIVCTSKSEAEVTNNEKLHLRYYTTDATNLTTDRHEASRGLFATVDLHIVLAFQRIRPFLLSLINQTLARK